MIKITKTSGLMCFSPPVMLATFLLELGLACYVLFRYGIKTTIRRLGFIVLICLALFQLAEYNVCGRFNFDALVWSRIGFIAITILPALGIHLVHELAQYKSRAMVIVPYLIAAVWIYIFGFSAIAFETYQCTSNYAIFQLQDLVGRAYFVYYYGLLFAALLFAGQKLSSLSKPRKRALGSLILGYFLFIIPTFIVNNLKPETMLGIPSVMCGFAIAFAFILVFLILPYEQKFTKFDKHKH